MTTDADLEISLSRRDTGSVSPSYEIAQRCTAAGNEKVLLAKGNTPLRVDDPRFPELNLDPAAYGAYLAGQLLAEPAMRRFFDQALAANAGDAVLHFRLLIGPEAAELHNLRWEALRLPEADVPLLTGERLAFSRYLSSDRREVPSRSAADTRALVAVADPSDAVVFGLAKIHKEQELGAALAGLGEIRMVEMATDERITLNSIAARLRDGCDILYLVAHGMLVDGQPWLFLEQADGTAARVPGRELATRIRELNVPPRLAVLASCQSAGTGEGEALAALGPRLAEAGVPAVIAMQGSFTIESAQVFMPPLFQELRRDGLADRAMAVARGAIRDRPDWWMPVLFTCLKSGRVWEPTSPVALPVIPRQPFEPETMYIPAGPFPMGCDPGPGIPEWETPRHPATLPAYRIGKYPVTNREYAEFVRRVKAQDVPKDAGWFLREPPAGRPDHPVTGVSWVDAVAYCRWLSQETGRGYRLPSEGEWEKACGNDFSRSPGCRTTEVVTTYRYPWGEGWDEERCNAGGSETTPVTTHPAGASPYGCEDMLGNVQQWTATLWGAQPGQPQQSYRDRPDVGPAIADPADLPAQARLVHRGGSFRSQPADLRCSARGNAPPDSKVAWRGFRVAMAIEEHV